jgi:hypothetical protein
VGGSVSRCIGSLRTGRGRRRRGRLGCRSRSAGHRHGNGGRHRRLRRQTRQRCGRTCHVHSRQAGVGHPPLILLRPCDAVRVEPEREIRGCETQGIERSGGRYGHVLKPGRLNIASAGRGRRNRQQCCGGQQPRRQSSIHGRQGGSPFGCKLILDCFSLHDISIKTKSGVAGCAAESVQSGPIIRRRSSFRWITTRWLG